MHRHPAGLGPDVTLMPGDLWCESEPAILGTILGSCVAVCLWDKRQRFGGMNHFILPVRPANAEPSPRFGDVAVPLLIERMIVCGSRQRDIQAKVFGGATVLRTGYSELSVGRRNVEVALAELRRQRIPIVASRLSGVEGVAIIHCTGCGDVWVRPIAGMTGSPLALRDVERLPWLTPEIDVHLFQTDGEGLPRAVSTRSTITSGLLTSCPACGVGGNESRSFSGVSS